MECLASIDPPPLMIPRLPFLGDLIREHCLEPESSIIEHFKQAFAVKTHQFTIGDLKQLELLFKRGIGYDLATRVNYGYPLGTPAAFTPPHSPNDSPTTHEALNQPRPCSATDGCRCYKSLVIGNRRPSLHTGEVWDITDPRLPPALVKLYCLGVITDPDVNAVHLISCGSCKYGVNWWRQDPETEPLIFTTDLRIGNSSEHHTPWMMSIGGDHEIPFIRRRTRMEPLEPAISKVVFLRDGERLNLLGTTKFSHMFLPMKMVRGPASCDQRLPLLAIFRRIEG